MRNERERRSSDEFLVIENNEEDFPAVEPVPLEVLLSLMPTLPVDNTPIVTVPPPSGMQPLAQVAPPPPVSNEPVDNSLVDNQQSVNDQLDGSEGNSNNWSMEANQPVNGDHPLVSNNPVDCAYTPPVNGDHPLVCNNPVNDSHTQPVGGAYALARNQPVRGAHPLVGYPLDDGESLVSDQPTQPFINDQSAVGGPSIGYQSLLEHPPFDTRHSSQTASSDNEWTSAEIDLPGPPNVTITDFQHYQSLPFLSLTEKLEQQRNMMLEMTGPVTEEVKRRWYNLTAERNHRFRVLYCETAAAQLLREVEAFERRCIRMEKEACCPDPVMGFFRSALQKITSLTPLVIDHLLTRTHESGLSTYPSTTPELGTSTTEPPDLSEFLHPVPDEVDRQPSTSRLQPLNRAMSYESYSSREEPPRYSREPPRYLKPGPPPPTVYANNFAGKKTVQTTYPTNSPKSEEYYSPTRDDLNPGSRVSDCPSTVPAGSLEERPSRNDQPRNDQRGSTSGSNGLIFEFTDAEELGLRRRTTLAPRPTSDQSLDRRTSSQDDTGGDDTSSQLHLSDCTSGSAPFARGARPKKK